MNCPRCQSIISVEQTHCEMCGSDILIITNLYKLSNFYYNKGLEKAEVRDLSGAVVMLRRSLKIIKSNTNARNLLGLILFEMGETVAALSEWVISKHFQPEDNAAEYFMVLVQSNPSKLEAKNQAIKKYNIALDASVQGNEDLAILQLKKVISLSPNFLRAIHLLSLLYIKNGDFERAKRLLIKAAQIDISNTMTLRYTSELNYHLSDDGSREELTDNIGSGIAPITKYREEKPNVLAWINWFLGMAIGIAVTFMLIVPTVKNNMRREYEKEEIDYAGELNILNANISSKEKEITSLKMRIQEKEDEISRFKEAEFDPDMYNPIFEIAKEYQAYVNGDRELNDDEIYLMVKNIQDLPDTVYANPSACLLIEDITLKLHPLAAEITYNIGKELYDKADYDEALIVLKDSYLYKPERDNVLYYLGQTCQQLGLYTEASTYYNILIDDFPNSAFSSEARNRLNDTGMQ